MGDDAPGTTSSSFGAPVAADDLSHAAPPAMASRRVALATLGGVVSGGAAWLLAGGAPAAANDAAKRRKRRDAKRKRRARNAANAADNPLGLKPIKFEVWNLGPNAISVEYGDTWPLRCCHTLDSQTIGIGKSAGMGTTTNCGYLWIGDRYWIDVFNGPLKEPLVSVAVGGQTRENSSYCCRTEGTLVLGREPLAEGRNVDVEMDGKVFSIYRPGDTNYKQYLIVLPRDLS